jgi:hypothetical protein
MELRTAVWTASVLGAAALTAGCSEAPPERPAGSPATPAATTRGSAPARPAALVSSACTEALVRVDDAASALGLRLEHREGRIATARARARAAREEAVAARTYAQAAELAAEAAGTAYDEAVAELDAFLAEHGTLLAEPEYSQAKALEAEADARRADYERAVAAARAAGAAATAAARAYNQLVDGYNRAARELNRLLGRADDARELYGEEVTRCLAERESTWNEAVSSLERRLGSAAGMLVGGPVSVECEPVSVWSERERETGDPEYRLGGYVDEGESTIHLAPRVCFALDALYRRGAGDLRCLRPMLRLRVPVCPPRIFELADAIETVAHEAMHVRGIGSEAVATCYGIQQAARIGIEAFGLGAAGARRLAAVELRFVERPPEYRSRECRAGGELDLAPDTPGWP